jgi:adenylate kinase
MGGCSVILIFLGPPGAGKGTQAKILEDELGYRQISTGDILRRHRAEKTALGAEAQGYMDAGKLVPDDLIIRMMEGELSHVADAIVDGFPRTIAQAEAFDDLLRLHALKYVAVVFDVDPAVLTERITGRWSNPRTGRVYHTVFNPPKTAGIDDDDGGPLIQREDDRAEVVQKRLAEYDEKTAPLIAYYESRDRALHVDALGKIDEVRAAILRVLPDLEPPVPEEEVVRE